jgi:ABC-type phosphate transport system substrate-binding protein
MSATDLQKLQEVDRMKFPSAHRLVPGCIISAAAVAALAAPGAANAELGAQCSGVNVTGQGASTQKLAQQTVWGPSFNTSTKSKSACAGAKGQGTGAKPEAKYTSTGSGAGLESWGANKHAAVYDATNGFIGTDEGPDATQKKEIEENETTLMPETLQTIPVLQLAVSVVVNLPSNCVATSKKNAGRLELNNVTLEGIYRGTITKWSQITEDSDKLSGAGCNPETPITPIVRKDGSGTTHIFKRYLGLINASSFTTEKEETKTWNQIAEGPENTTWPKAANVVKPAATGGGALVAKVAETPSSIGYAALADARANGSFNPGAKSGGPGTEKFWAPVQNNGLGTTKQKFADPSSNGDAEAVADSNCKNTEYTDGEVAFPPKNTSQPWNAVTTRTIEKKYPLCGLTFDLAFTSFGSFPGTSLGEATTVHDYLKFVVDSKGGGGQKAIENHDYLALPKGAVLSEAQAGAASIAK